MTDALVLEMVKALARDDSFVCFGDAIFALGARAMNDVQLNSALSQASRCESGQGVWIVHTVDIWDEEMQVALRLDPPTIVSIGPSR